MEKPIAIYAAPFPADELREALPPIASLISKSEKARQKLTPGTWQHAMLRDNLKALRAAAALMNPETTDPARFTQDEFEEALRAMASMISKTEKAQTLCLLRASQHTLL